MLEVKIKTKQIDGVEFVITPRNYKSNRAKIEVEIDKYQKAIDTLKEDLLRLDRYMVDSGKPQHKEMSNGHILKVRNKIQHIYISKIPLSKKVEKILKIGIELLGYTLPNNQNPEHLPMYQELIKGCVNDVEKIAIKTLLSI